MSARSDVSPRLDDDNDAAMAGQTDDNDSSDTDFHDDDDDDDDSSDVAAAASADGGTESDKRGGGMRMRGGRGSLANASMTESYSEIMNSPTDSGGGLLDDVIAGSSTGPYPIPKRRPGSLPMGARNSSFPQGTVSVGDGNMMHFVADNLEHKIKAASPNPRRDIDAVGGRGQSFDTHGEAQSLINRQFLSSIPQIDPNVLNDIEIEAQYLASNIDNLTENLCNLLHSISAITADNVETYRTAVTKLTDSMDANIKTMYTIMAKTEEISNGVKNVEALAVRIKELRRMVDVLDSVV